VLAGRPMEAEAKADFELEHEALAEPEAGAAAPGGPRASSNRRRKGKKKGGSKLKHGRSFKAMAGASADEKAAMREKRREKRRTQSARTARKHKRQEREHAAFMARAVSVRSRRRALSKASIGGEDAAALARTFTKYDVKARAGDGGRRKSIREVQESAKRLSRRQGGGGGGL